MKRTKQRDIAQELLYVLIGIGLIAFFCMLASSCRTAKSTQRSQSAVDSTAQTEVVKTEVKQKDSTSVKQTVASYDTEVTVDFSYEKPDSAATVIPIPGSPHPLKVSGKISRITLRHNGSVLRKDSTHLQSAEARTESAKADVGVKKKETAKDATLKKTAAPVWVWLLCALLLFFLIVYAYRKLKSYSPL